MGRGESDGEHKLPRHSRKPHRAEIGSSRGAKEKGESPQRAPAKACECSKALGFPKSVRMHAEQDNTERERSFSICSKAARRLGVEE